MSVKGPLAWPTAPNSTVHPDNLCITALVHTSFDTHIAVASHNTVDSRQCNHTATIHCLYKHIAHCCMLNCHSYTAAVRLCSNLGSNFDRFDRCCLGITGCSHSCWWLDFGWASFTVGWGLSMFVMG